MDFAVAAYMSYKTVRRTTMSMIISFDVGLANLGLCIAIAKEGTTCAEIVHWDLFDLGTIVAEEASAVLVDKLKFVFKDLRDSLNTWVLIERQLPENVKCMCLSHCIFTFFLSRFSKLHVSFVSASAKPLVLNGKKRKRESVDVVADILKGGKWLDWLNKQKKKDDLCDAYLQIVGNLEHIKYFKEDIQNTHEQPKHVIEILD